MNIIETMDHRGLFAGWFRRQADGTDSWASWRALLAAVFHLPMSDDQLALYRECTGRDHEPGKEFSETWLCCGRRSGKSLILALVACYLAVFVKTWQAKLQPGERGTILVLASDRRQSRTIFRYIQAMLEIPVFANAKVLERTTADTLELANRITIEVSAASFRSVRGYTIIAALCDEIAFWRTDEFASNPDEEILSAIRPAMLTMPGSMLLCASSPYARRGTMWKAFRKHHGVDDAPVLFWKAATTQMNPTVPLSLIEEKYEEDYASADAEYGGNFRTDIASFVSSEVVESVVALGRHELPYIASNQYVAFCDPAGGSGSDSYALAIAHRDRDGIAILDCIVERRPPFSPDAVSEEMADALKRYKISSVMGDRWGGEFPKELMRKCGIHYEESERPKSDLYRECLPVLNSGRCQLLDHKRLISQLLGLERRTARSGKDSIDHAPGLHDDIANCVAGVLVRVQRPSVLEIFGILGADDGFALSPSLQALNPGYGAGRATAAQPQPAVSPTPGRPVMPTSSSGLNRFGTS